MKMATPRSTAVTRVGSLLLVALWHLCYHISKPASCKDGSTLGWIHHQGIPLWHAEPDTISRHAKPQINPSHDVQPQVGP